MAFSLKRGRAAVPRAVALSLLALLVIVAALLAWLVRSPLPKVNGTLTLDGISAPVVIRRDAFGIPHIEAQNEADLMFGEGFACGQDRLWQIDMLRRTAEGKLSEVAGPGALDVDRYMRTLGLATAAAHDVITLHGQTLIDARAYAAGVNASMAHPLPIEFRLLGYRPQPWTPLDSIAIIKLMAQRLDDQWTQIELRALLSKKLGVKAAYALMDTAVPALEHYIPATTSTPIRQTAGGYPNQELALIEMAGLEMPVSPLPRDPQSGSNNWAVAGRHVTTGKPVLSNDTHLEHAVPSNYWLVHIRGGGLDVEGFIVPGIPLVALGHNERIAFGVTSGDAAVQDLFIEQFRSPKSDEYLANGKWLHAQHRIERIEVKGQQPTILDVLVTRHGPVMARHGTSAYALAWTVLRSGNELELLRQLDHAANWNQFQQALEQVVGPMFNWAYADVSGNIGYHLAGKVPKRLRGDGSVPVEGQDDRYDWHGYLPFDGLPHTFNPPQGYVATANNRLAPRTTAVGSSWYFDAPYRVNEIYRRLALQRQFTPRQIGDIQSDVFDLPRWVLARVTAQTLRHSADARFRMIASQLASWNGMDTTDATAPTFVTAETHALERLLFAQKLGALQPRYDKDFNIIVPMQRALMYNDVSLAAIGITRSTVTKAIPVAALQAARDVGAIPLGSQKAKPSRARFSTGIDRITPWGIYNAGIFHHPAGRSWPLTALFNIKDVAQPGGQFTVYAARPDHGPASRLLDDLSNWDNSSMLIPLGESGQFNDLHYADLVQRFVGVQWVNVPFSQAAVANATKDTLTLRP